MPIETQLGTADETTYGTAVTVSRFQPFISESIQPETFRTRTPGLRNGKRVARTDEMVPGVLGYTGSLELPIESKGFGIWLARSLGAVASSGPTGGAYQYVGTIDPDNCLPSFTTQVNRPFAPCNATDQAFTWEGCQVASWELSVSVDEVVKFSAEIVAEDGTTGTSLAAATYPSSVQPLAWSKAALTIGGTSVPITQFSLKCNNNLKTDRHYLQNSPRRAKAARDDFPEITVEFEADFDSLTQYNRFVAETAAGTQAAVVFTATAATAITTGVYPGVSISLPAVDFTEVGVSVGGPEMLMQSITGMVLDNGTDEPISVTYTTSDSTA